MHNLKKTSMLLVLLMVVGSCIEPYEPALKDTHADFLVVDAFINATSDSAGVVLSRAVPLSSADRPPVEANATVTITDDANTVYTLAEATPGVYVLPRGWFSRQRQYKLDIRTASGSRYASGFIPLLETPSIDAVSFRQVRDGIEITVDSRGDERSSRYYRWSFTETYKYRAPHSAGYYMKGGQVLNIPIDETMYECYKTEPVQRIVVGTTNRLAGNVVSHFPLQGIADRSYKLGIRYSILVKQHSLTEEAYQYWSNMQRINESLGGLFDPMPSQVIGNIKSLTDPDEPVIGFFSGSTVDEKRIFISTSDLPPSYTLYEPSRCLVDTIPMANIPFLPDGTILISPVYPPMAALAPIGYTRAPISCVDCRAMRGGTTIKPDFWE
jgi:hypothetical protein